MANNYGENVNGNVTSNTGSGSDEDWKNIEPMTVEDDDELLSALNGESGDKNGDRSLNVGSTNWGGMETGAINYDSTQNKDWLSTIPEQYQGVANQWQNQQGVVKIIPVQQKQKFTYSTVAYIATKQEEPKTQVFPISDVSVVPHQITFDFYDTTEGRVGVSNAVEKHMQVEFDVYLTDLIAQFWIFGEDNQYDLGVSKLPVLRRDFWNAVENGTYLGFENDLEQTKEFAEFRTTFLQQHSGWVCKFVSHAFGVFQGVITDVNYSINSGESFAKWHVKIEEAIFTNAYSKDGQKPQEQSGNDKNNNQDNNNQDMNSQEKSGDAANEG